MSKKRKMSEMEQLPQEICTEILCRLPIQSMIESKRVCPAWRNLIESPEFAQFVPLIHMVEFPLISPTPSPIPLIRPYKIHKVRGNFNISIVKMGLADSVPVVRASVNGLILLLHRLSPKQQQLWVCNPITREYLTIPNPPRYVDYDFGYGSGPPIVINDQYGKTLYSNTAPDYGNYNFGFGVSRRSNKYKVVWISGRSEWHVFTLGTRGEAEWRTLANGPTLGRFERWNTECAFLAGNLYWLDPDETRIWCFDLETEVFTTFSAPPPPTLPDGRSYTRSLSVLTECLCLCDASWNNAGNSEIEVGLMSYKERDGVWSRKYVIGGNFGMRRTIPNVFPIKVLGDGSVLLGERGKPNVFCHTNSISRLYPGHRRFGFELGNWYPNAALFTPNFLPLKTLLKGMEEVEIQSL